MNNIDITIIIPIHQYDNEIKTLLTRALKSVDLTKSKVLISCNEKISKNLSDDFKNIDITTSEKDSFSALVNNGVDKVETKWFSILEFDDEYSNIWFDNFYKVKDFKQDVSVFVPLTDLIENETNKFIGFGNESVWASSFSNELGYIDNDCLQNFFDFYMTGSIFNTSDWKESGGLKESFKLTFWYEFLLRYTYLNKKVYVIPRIGYKHMLNRKNSLIDLYTNSISEKESKFWINLAKQDYFFTKERDSSKYIYNETNDENNEEA